jgi:hypothetical protein
MKHRDIINLDDNIRILKLGDREHEDTKRIFCNSYIVETI